MNIAIIGTGNVGGALATKWANAGHQIFLGVRNIANFKGKVLLSNVNTQAFSIKEAVAKSEVILLATPAIMSVDVAQSLGDTTGKVIIDSMNIIMGRGPAGFTNTSDAILANTVTKDVVKCFNITGFGNMIDTKYDQNFVDMFVAGSSVKGKEVATTLSKDAGFADCYDIGDNDKFQLMEQFAWFWINLAIKGQNREFAFKILKR